MYKIAIVASGVDVHCTCITLIYLLYVYSYIIQFPYCMFCALHFNMTYIQYISRLPCPSRSQRGSTYLDYPALLAHRSRGSTYLDCPALLAHREGLPIQTTLPCSLIERVYPSRLPCPARSQRGSTYLSTHMYTVNTHTHTHTHTCMYVCVQSCTQRWTPFNNE